MSVFGRGISVKGEIRSLEDLSFEGHVDGPIFCEEGAIVVAEGATIRGDVIARDITIHGRVEGQLVATEVVDVRAGSKVTGQVMARRFILGDGADFAGRVEPQHLEAALRVARFQQKKRDTA
jgi:cytoskeletal protein CcmA (bactofilin family)